METMRCAAAAQNHWLSTGQDTTRFSRLFQHNTDDHGRREQRPTWFLYQRIWLFFLGGSHVYRWTRRSQGQSLWKPIEALFDAWLCRPDALGGLTRNNPGCSNPVPDVDL